MAGKPVAIIMGSQSDWATMKHAAETLDALGVGYDALIVSAHRTPDRLFKFGKSAPRKGFKVVIAGAGGAAHLPGMTASLTALPVFGVPMNTHALEGKDSLLSIMQMPAGIPVGTLAIGKPGAINAALLAAAVLALSDARLAKRLDRLAGGADPVRRQAPEGLRRCSSPTSTIGILGGGQLGRMLALAAAQTGLQVPRLRAQSGCASLRRGAPRHHARTIPTPARSTGSPPTSTSSPTSSRTSRRKPRRSLPPASRWCRIPQVLAITQDRAVEKELRRRPRHSGHAALRASMPATGLAAALDRVRAAGGAEDPALRL